MNSQTAYNTPLPFRAPDITREQLKQLREKWGENRSKVIIRCIDHIWQQEIGNQSREKSTKERRK